MKCVFVFFAAFLAYSAAEQVKRDAIYAPAYYTVPTAYSSQYVAAPVVSSGYSSQYVAAPLISSAYVAAPNPVIARASRILGEPGFVSRYVATPVATPVAATPVATPVAATPVATPVAAVDTVETLAAPAKLVVPAAAVRTVAAPLVAAPARYTYIA